MKEQFLENLETIPFDSENLKTPEFQPLQQTFDYICENRNKEASLLVLDYIESEIRKEEKDPKNISTKMLVISEIPNVDKEIRDLALDVMLLVEEDDLLESVFPRIESIKSQVT